MSQWDEMLSNHPAQQSLSEFAQLLSQLRDDEDSDILSDIERLQSVKELVSGRLDTVEPSLAPTPALSNIHRHVQQAVTHLTSYEVDRNAATLGNAHKAADDAVVAALQLPVPMNLHEIEGLGETVTRIRRSAGQHMRRLDDDVATFQKTLEDLKHRLAETKREVSQQKSRLDAAISDFQTQSVNTERERQKEFDGRQSDRKQSFDEFSSAIESHWEEEVKPALAEQHAQAERIVSAIANVGMAGGYQRQANWARRERLVWQAIAVISMLGFVGLAIWAVWDPFVGKEVAWTVFGARVFVAAAVGVLAAYGGRQGDRQARRERFNRQMELELASLQPYIATLEESDQRELTKQMAERFFGLHSLPEERESGEDSALPSGRGFFDLLKMLILNKFR